MGCQPTRCRECGHVYKACQLMNGLCANCIPIVEERETQEKVQEVKKIKIDPDLLKNIEIDGHS